jgi:hypothetical protein
MSVCVTRGERDRAGIVDDDVQATEARRGLIDRALDRGLVVNVDH